RQNSKLKETSNQKIRMPASQRIAQRFGTDKAGTQTSNATMQNRSHVLSSHDMLYCRAQVVLVRNAMKACQQERRLSRATWTCSGFPLLVVILLLGLGAGCKKEPPVPKAEAGQTAETAVPSPRGSMAATE